jgi:hypothetical protein
MGYSSTNNSGAVSTVQSQIDDKFVTHYATQTHDGRKLNFDPNNVNIIKSEKK